MIIASNLDQDQDGKLLELIKENKEALGWTLGDLKATSLIVVQHRIHSENGAKPYSDVIEE